AEKFLLDLHLLRSRFNYELHVPQLHWRSGATNPGPTLFSLFLSHQTALYAVGIDFFNVRQSAIDLFARDVAQDHSDATGTEPLRDARAKHAGGNHSRVHDFFGRRSRRSLLVFFREEEIANEVLRRLRL